MPIRLWFQAVRPIQREICTAIDRSMRGGLTVSGVIICSVEQLCYAENIVCPRGDGFPSPNPTRTARPSCSTAGIARVAAYPVPDRQLVLSYRNASVVVCRNVVDEHRSIHAVPLRRAVVSKLRQLTKHRDNPTTVLPFYQFHHTSQSQIITDLLTLPEGAGPGPSPRNRFWSTKTVQKPCFSHPGLRPGRCAAAANSALRPVA